MKRLAFTLTLIVGASVAACGDDDGTSSTEDALDAGGGTEETEGEGTEAEETEETEGEETEGEETEGEETEGEEGPDGGDVSDFMISASAFEDGDELPDEYTCEGKPFGDGISPELSWSGAPDDTVTYALVFMDTSLLPDAPQFAYHYAAWNIPVSVDGIPEGLSEGATPDELEGGEQFRAGPPREPSFFGPCPSWQNHCFGEDRVTDSYSFTLYAFDSELEVPEYSGEGNYVHELDLFFAENALEVTEVTATSDASPSSAPMCPADAGAPLGDGGEVAPEGDGGGADMPDSGGEEPPADDPDGGAPEETEDAGNEPEPEAPDAAADAG